jgi:hypothetical protein
VCILNDVKDDRRIGSPGGNRFTGGESAEDRRNVTTRVTLDKTRSSELTPVQHCVYDMHPCTCRGTLCVDTCSHAQPSCDTPPFLESRDQQN